MLKMNWFFNLVFLGTTWCILYAEEVTSSESLVVPKLEVIESFFKSGYGNTSYRESIDDGRPRLIGAKENPLEDLSYRHHGAHPANIKSWKLQCVWNAVNSVAGRKLKKKQSKTLPEVRELCNNQAWEDCGVDFNNANCNFTAQYRSIDGTCNNIVNTGWGSAPRPYERFIHSDYGNGVSTFRLSADGEPLPNARKISRALSNSNKAAEPKVTLMLTQWGQFQDHDITLTPEREIDDELKDPVEGSSTMECCDGGQYDKSVSLGVDCVPINVTDDSFYGRDGRECIRFVRSMPTSSGCVNSPMEQINQNTAFVDGSMVYGSDAEVANFVRTGFLGLLNTTESEHVGNGQPLPPRGGEGFAHRCPIESEERCFLAGDVRVDEIPGLTAMHTTFIRLHNIIAEDLCILNPSWCGNDEQLFQETRRIVIALIQQITYRDWLPLVVGQTLMDRYNLNSVNQGYSDTYDANVNPTIRNVFATAAFRFGHSLISEVIKTARADGNLPYPGNFFNLNLLECDVTSPSSLLKGLTRSPSAPIDAIVEPAFTNHLFADHPADDGIFYGLDLLSINIQRGRDHGIPGYTEWRKFCGLEDVTTFRQLKNYMPKDLVKSFKHIYQNVRDIDLFPAGMAEHPTADGILGPTFSCLIARQFSNMKHGDRFWYERQGQPKPFTTVQLSAIRSQNLASLLCKVSEHASFSFQPNPFSVESDINPSMNCSSYNFINLQPWNEHQEGKHSIACEHFDLNIECAAGLVIKVILANYGRSSLDICPTPNGPLVTEDSLGCSSETSNQVLNDRCNGKEKCTVGAFNGIFGDPCPGHYKYLEVDYVCEPQGCNGGVNIGGQCLTISTEKRSWNSAKEMCSLQNGRLASIIDPQALKDYLSRKSGEYWLGGSDAKTEGIWVWENGKPLGDEFPWKNGEPDDWKNNEDCLQYISLDSLQGYSDAGCSSERKYVCEEL